MNTPSANLRKRHFSYSSFSKHFESFNENDSEPENWLIDEMNYLPKSAWLIKVKKGSICSIKTIDDYDVKILLDFKSPLSFSAKKRINYCLKEDGIVNLHLFDSFGNEVETLINFNQKAGMYAIEFDTEHLPAGAYYYQLSSDNFKQEIQKMILI